MTPAAETSHDPDLPAPLPDDSSERPWIGEELPDGGEGVPPPATGPSSPAASREPAAPDWLTGGGAMGKLIRAKDWSRTPLGHLASWPQSLRTAVSLCLASNFPINIIWGPGRVQIYNDGYWPICGAKHPRSMGQDFKECWLSAWDAVGEAFENASAGETAFLVNRRMFLDRNGYLEETFFTFSLSPIRDESGGVGGCFHPVTEMTQQTLVERRLQVLRDLADGTAEANSVSVACERIAQTLAAHELDLPFVLLYRLDPEGRRATLAASAGLAGGTLASPAMIDLAAPPPPCWPLAEAARELQVVEMDDVEQRFGPLVCGPYPESPRAALVLPLRISGMPQPCGLLVAGVSARRALDEAYRTFYRMLQEGVTNALTNARAYEEERQRAEGLAELDRANTAFFSNVSHEFRTPLTLMLGPLEETLANDSSALPAADRERLTLAHRNSLRLLKLVNTLLDFSRIEAGRVQASYEPTDLPALTADLASVFRSAIERAGLRLLVNCKPLPEPVYVDWEMWEKIVLNLLSNALKFTLAGEIEVSLRQVESSVELTVRDTGAGIPAAELARVFERFHRVAGTRGRTYEGSGIGLALVQELVKLHGGAVRVESTVGAGSTFTVTVPLGHAHLPAERLGVAKPLASTGIGAQAFVEEALRWLPEGQGSEPQGIGVGGEGLARPELTPDPQSLIPRLLTPDPDPLTLGAERPRILLADDNADMRQYVRRLLGAAYEIEAVPDGEAALVAVRRELPALVLADIMMPGLDGFELLRALRNDAATRSLPIIMLSARAGEEARVEGLEAGADDYLIKPFSARELLARVEAHLKLTALRAESTQALRESEARLRQALDAAAMGAWRANLATGLGTRDANLNRILGLEPVESTQPIDDCFRLVHSDDRAAAMGAWQQAVATRGAYEVEFRITREDGSLRWLRECGRFIPGQHQQPDRVTGVTLDVTERRQAEEALREADRRKDEFLAMLAHELRNPLSPILNAVRIESKLDPADPRLPLQRDVIQRQVEQMKHLLDDLLDVSRITRSKIELHPERLELAAVLGAAVEASRPLLEDKGHQLAVSLPPETVWLEADPIRITQVFTNLLNNAAKYTDPGGQISLSAAVEGGFVSIRVCDTGIGMAPAVVARVFDLFAQAQRSLDRSQGGLGIGLTVVRRLVEMHGGEVSARSAGPGKGSEFIVRLPLSDFGFWILDFGLDPTKASDAPESLTLPPIQNPKSKIESGSWSSTTTPMRPRAWPNSWNWTATKSSGPTTGQRRCGRRASTGRK